MFNLLEIILPITTGLIGGFAIVYSLRHTFIYAPLGHSMLRIDNMQQLHNTSQLLRDLFDEVPGVTFQDKLNHLSNCHCCDRHQVNKPTVFQPWYETPFNNTQNIYPCMCNCRHVARFICRQANNPPAPTRENSPNSVIDL